MSFQNRHFINFSDFTKQDILSLFEKTDKLTPHYRYQSKSACLLFFENSTRTQMSFDLAVRDCGMQSIVFNPETSSLKKGETFEDTLLNLQAMGFDLFVIRHGYPDENLSDLTKKIRVPIVNAGEGVSGHPTQALLDCYTILHERGQLEGEKVLFVGDIKHSRVVQSNVELMEKLGVHVAYCGPTTFLPKEHSVRVFESLDEGMSWATVTMFLRTQFERHAEYNPGLSAYAHSEMKHENRETYIKNYSLTTERLQKWKKDGIILHPGPFNRGIELQSEVLDDSRIRIFKQVENGRKIRCALIDSIIGGDKS